MDPSKEDDLPTENPLPEIESELEEKKLRLRHPKLNLQFFNAQDEAVHRDRLWDLFCQVAATYPTLEEYQAQNPNINPQDAAIKHLDTLMYRIRHWAQVRRINIASFLTQKEYKYPISLKAFGERVQKESCTPEFLEYRYHLLKRYKLTDWKNELIGEIDENVLHEFDSQQEPRENQPPVSPSLKEKRRILLKKQRQARLEMQAKTHPDTPLARRQQALERQRLYREKHTCSESSTIS